MFINGVERLEKIDNNKFLCYDWFSCYGGFSIGDYEYIELHFRNDEDRMNIANFIKQGYIIIEHETNNPTSKL